MTISDFRDKYMQKAEQAINELSKNNGFANIPSEIGIALKSRIYLDAVYEITKVLEAESNNTILLPNNFHFLDDSLKTYEKKLGIIPEVQLCDCKQR